ncbi:ribonuclease III [Chloroflexota bacterium]
MADLVLLEQVLGVSFQVRSLLEQALVHSSYLNENPHFTTGHNERMEFLGDAILGLVIAEKLYQDFPEHSEGEMSKYRAALVSRDALNVVAQKINLGEYLYLGKGEEAGGGRKNPANLAGAMEAIIAAIFLDQGLAISRDFIVKYWDKELAEVMGQGIEVDYKSRLQELVQSKGQLPPSYQLRHAVGPDHAKVFTVEVMVGGEVMGTGSGKSKKTAETAAAHEALKYLAGDD